MSNLSAMVDETLVSIEGMVRGSERVTFTAASGRQWVMFHYQNCCEHVSVEEVVGDFNDLLHTPLILSEETSSEEGLFPLLEGTSHTWTFYNFRTQKGSVTLRWLGVSNGYYSEAVTFEERSTFSS